MSSNQKDANFEGIEVVEITVHAGRVFNHPYEDYSNLRPSISLKANLRGGVDVDQATKALQAKAEGLVEDHKQHMLNSLKEIHRMQRAKQEISSLERQMLSAQQRLKELREDHQNVLEKTDESPVIIEEKEWNMG